MPRSASFAEIIGRYASPRVSVLEISLLSDVVNRFTQLSTRGLEIFARSHTGAAATGAAFATDPAVPDADTGAEIASAAGRIGRWSGECHVAITKTPASEKSARLVRPRAKASRCRVSACCTVRIDTPYGWRSLSS